MLYLMFELQCMVKLKIKIHIINFHTNINNCKHSAIMQKSCIRTVGHAAFVYNCGNVSTTPKHIIFI
jgi:hypothetical protein